jgi:hypothetical protein
MSLYTIIIVGLFGCGSINHYFKGVNVKPTEPLPYKTSLSSQKNAEEFVVSVKNKEQGIKEVRESVRFEATKYCLLYFGTSDINWKISQITQDWAFDSNSEKLIFSGQCEVR